jgi:pimeloyl-ACP methyl ester carboxylesterase
MGTDPDPEESGACNRKNYAPMAEAASTEILAVIDYARQQKFVDSNRLVIVGQSVGGYSTVATTAKNPPGLIAAINFAGGSGGDPVGHPGEPCEGHKLEKMYATFDRRASAYALDLHRKRSVFFTALQPGMACRICKSRWQGRVQINVAVRERWPQPLFVGDKNLGAAGQRI